MIATIKKGTAKGSVLAPPSKSMAHRLMISAGLSKEHSEISNIKLSQDVLATMDCLNALGAKCSYDEEKETLSIDGVDISKTKDALVTLPCRECGSTLRFMVPIALVTGAKCHFTGSERLMERPMTVYEDICEKQGLSFVRENGGITTDGVLESGTYKVKGNISSQFISGLLFVLPLLEGDSKIELIPPVESRSYINMTVSALKRFGVNVNWESDTVLNIPGKQSYCGRTLPVEGDYSNGAFLEAFNCLSKNDYRDNVKVSGLLEDSLQGDKVYLEHFKSLNKEYSVIDIKDCPDLGPILFAVAAVNHGALFTGTERLKIKESDRVLAMKEELAKLGVTVIEGDNQVEIKNSSLCEPKEMLHGHNDHRIVMAMSVLLTLTGGSIDEAEAVRKSFPDFFEYLEKMGIEVHLDGTC